ncbi:NAD(P)-binding protein [Lentinus tigrinus ALCF2SS1-7]|uniref:NAD(P)-binding protein n=1 Tax=Lentinus tigrinus ALCF2SS1-6 TaxID=1328759 RepID=A0A5C2SLD5_9APHY|nr:NAD(P)-binding protein [Lentinus tigrinus ALCF2SS1-6]RPD82833.1 NAD(P)-binding protein [Lentinus tigrinus ALCF2SS1-7]
MPFYAVVGASRGIGLEFVRELAARHDTSVFAIVRNAAKCTHLQAVAKNFKSVYIVEADVVDYRSLEQAANRVSELTGGTLDFLIHNAGRIDPETIFEGYDNLSNMDGFDTECLTSFKINALGTIHGIAAFLPLLRAGSTKKIVVIGAAAADLKLIDMADMVAYCMSKAAAHVATTKWAIHLKDEGFIVVSINPGLVDTSETKTGERSPPVELGVALNSRGFPVQLQTLEESVAAQLKVIENLKPEDNGLLIAHDTGKEFAI